MKLQRGILLMLLVLTPVLSAQQVSIPKSQLIGERDKAMEDELAKSFETARSDAKLPPLTRIRHRSSLEQRVCTIAQTGDLGKLHSGDLLAFYKTAQSESGSELTRVAIFNKMNTKRKKKVLYYPRYSVAVWRVNDPKTGDIEYWVGVGRYGSALEEFVDYHFTDDVYYHNLRNESVTPVCRGK